MKKNLIISRIGAVATSVVMIAALAACGNSGSDTGSYTAEPAAGTPSTYTGKLPMPSTNGVYNNPQPREKLKDDGSATFSLSSAGPDWNYFSVNGNTAYMDTLWSYYMPVLWISNADGSKLTPNPNYITSYDEKTVDGKQTITITFSPKAKWNDGAEIDWTAVEAAWKVRTSDGYTPSSTDGWERVESVKQGTSAKQAVITMAKPYYPANTFIDIYNPKAANVQTFTSGWSNNPHSEWGAGPYIVDSHSDSQIVFKTNPKWWGDKPKLTTVTYKILESQAEINAFKNGEIDAASVGTKDKLAIVHTIKDAQIRRGFGSSTATYQLNVTKDSLKDIAVRKAFNQALDRSQLVKIVYAGLDWTEDAPGSLLVAPYRKGYENNMPKDSGFSTANAKKTLEGAGYKMGSNGYYQKNGKDLAITYTDFSDSPTQKAVALAIQKMMKGAGIKINIDIKPSSEFSTVLVSGNWEIIAMRWQSGSPYGYVGGKQIYGSQSENNVSHAGNASIDSAFDEVPTISDTAKQLSSFNKAEKKALALYGQLPIWSGPTMTAYKKGLANVGPARYQTILKENVGWMK
ncbi:ABC transporter family substrate-binding protein [Scardovia wiggsiae]|uniref:ABC transporter family substrate-binding protein n=1 Tax=Scardovia wiggsiae TaxID=230143 RepID=UPI003BADABFE